MIEAPIIFVVFAIVGALSLAMPLIFSWLIRPDGKGDIKYSTYECGIPTYGQSRTVGFYFFHYALIFLVAEVAGIVLFILTPLVRTITFEAVGILALVVVLITLMMLYLTKKRDYLAA